MNLPIDCSPIIDHLDKMSDDEHLLRRRLALFSETLLKGYLYGDDGELQLQYMLPYTNSPMIIDFIRESVKEIDKKLSDYGIMQYKENTEKQQGSS